MTSPPLYAVIMAGGSGTRFWPASRIARPKQFLPISGGLTMIEETFRRLEGLVPAERVLVVTAESQVALVAECLPELPAENILAEPCARNTAPCVAWAAHEIARRDPDAMQVILPADHVIQPRDAFQRTLAAAAAAAVDGGLFTFGVEPDHPATGYGYIKTSEQLGLSEGEPVFAVERFVEKPNLEKAIQFLGEGGFYWNAGIFVWSTQSIVDAIARYVPKLDTGIRRIFEGADLATEYATLPAEPVDVAIMERSDQVRLLPITYTWNDVGSWLALSEITEKDANSNGAVLAEDGKLVSIESTGNLVYAEGARVVALVGVEGLAVVQTDKATLVCPLDRAQDVKRVVDELKASGKEFL
ncbi:MAG: sugar phosphate nucleotidyltransferase [Planctomycetota bacterium]|nr:sugar phosphate nucleotidyltransferase [Planctomycetota bacterium]MDG2142354.1 sugar phosphate nucleotidyltransferase [Planctomycetota bacterium]